MKKSYVLQSDIDANALMVLVTPQVRHVATLKRIKLPPEAESAGWTEIKVGYSMELLSDVSEYGKIKDITESVFGVDKVYLGIHPIDVDVDYEILTYPFYFYIEVKNKNENSKFYTFVVEFD